MKLKFLSTFIICLYHAFFKFVNANSVPPNVNLEKLMKEHLLEVTDKNYEIHFKGNSTKILVAFSTPWCVHCQNLMPELVKASMFFKSRNMDYKIAKINCDINKITCFTTHNITGYPILKYYYNGTFHNFQGSRAHMDIVSYLLTFGREKNPHFTKVEEIEAYVKNYPLTTVFFGKNYTDEYYYFNRNVQTNTESVFAYCDSEECYNYYNVKEGQMIIFNSISPRTEEKQIVIPISEKYNDESKVAKLIDIYSAPHVMEFGFKATRLAYIHKMNIVYMFSSSSDPNRGKYAEAMYKTALKEKV